MKTKAPEDTDPGRVDAVQTRAKGRYGTLEWFAQEYGNVRDDPWGLTWRPSQLVRYERTLAVLADIAQPIATAADLGCATGDFAQLLSRRMPGIKMLGMDFVQTAVERARERFPHIDFARESIFSVGEKYEKQFDLIACLEILYYLERAQLRDALKSVKRTLKSGGHVVFSSVISGPPHFSKDELLALVSSEFQIVKSDVLHLKLVNLMERVGIKLARLVSKVSRGRLDGGVFLRCSRFPLPAVRLIERLSRVFKRLAASHVIVLARSP